MKIDDLDLYISHTEYQITKLLEELAKTKEQIKFYEGKLTAFREIQDSIKEK